MTDDPRRRVPRTDVVLADPDLATAIAILGRARVKAVVVEAQERARRGDIAPEAVVAATVAALPDNGTLPDQGTDQGTLPDKGAPQNTALRPVLNATGVVLHTNLGRAPLAPEAITAITRAAGHTDVELDLRTGRRATRGRTALTALAARVPDAGAVHVVNNGAAALVLAATALAQNKEIVVSRGELIEIGDGFRLPDLLQSTGARLREVGTTNRTHLRDYAEATGPDTAFILKVHPSNFVTRGFVASVDVATLATLEAPVVFDIGSGLLTPDPLLPDEPDATTALRQGAALVTASGDKLLGGPQAGVILGRADIVERLRRHPLARALRVDKLTLAALEATLRATRPPTHDALHADPDDIRRRTERLRADVPTLNAEVVPNKAVVGGGGAPGVELDSWALALPERYAEPLRTGDPPVLGRVERGRLLLDLRCVPADRDADLHQALHKLA